MKTYSRSPSTVQLLAARKEYAGELLDLVGEMVVRISSSKSVVKGSRKLVGVGVGLSCVWLELTSRCLLESKHRIAWNCIQGQGEIQTVSSRVSDRGASLCQNLVKWCNFMQP